MTRTVGVLCVALLLVLAGCSGASTAPTTNATGTSAGTDAGDAEPTQQTTVGDAEPTETASTTDSNTAADLVTVNGDLPVDAVRVYERVAALTGWSPVVVTVDAEESIENGPAIAANESTFAGVMGLTPPENSSADSITGYATRSSVYVRTGDRSPADVESTLAHELTHVLQSGERVGAAAWPQLQGNRLETYSALLEGGAVTVEEAYEVQYMNGTRLSPGEAVASYRNRSAYWQYVLFPYTVGYAYVANHTDSPSDLHSVYENPPRTTEELIHDLDPGSEPPMTLSTTVQPGGNRYTETVGARGEFFVRVALHTELPWNRAARAGTGWGADSLVTVEADDETVGYVWGTRWDSTADADEFATAMVDYLDARTTRTDGGAYRDDGDAFRLVRGDDDVVVLLAGDPATAGNASVEIDDASVTVALAGNGMVANDSAGNATVANDSAASGSMTTESAAFVRVRTA